MTIFSHRIYIPGPGPNIGTFIRVIRIFVPPSGLSKDNGLHAAIMDHSLIREVHRKEAVALSARAIFARVITPATK